MRTKTLKNVDDETWRDFRILAVRAGVTMAILLRLMVKEFEKNNRKFWSSLLDSEKLLSDNEARDMLKISEEIREERGFRE